MRLTMEQGLLLLLAVSLSITVAAFSQCVTAKDMVINGTIPGSIIDGSTRFSLELLRTLNDNMRGDKNAQGLFFSPYSIWSTLMVTYMGAEGATEQEMENILGIEDADKMTTWEAFRNIRNFNTSDASYNSANRIYFQDGKTFKDGVKEMLGGDIAFLDFKSGPGESREHINKWVEEQTQRRIKDVIPTNAVHARTNMVIANAVYFKGKWLRSFGCQSTTRGNFTTPSGQEISVNMMKTRGRFSYGKSEDLQCSALELPYQGSALSMIILLPKNRTSGVDILTSNLTPERLGNLLSSMKPSEFKVTIPKFKMEDSFELSDVLNQMGLETLFDPERADLSGFTGTKEFTVDAVHHKTFIEVNEEGTEAAAATVKTSVRKSGVRRPFFTADHPFVYFIRDNLSNAIIFLGTVQKPTELENA